ncbi:ArdC-like ssDNA-binding domain-containing protein [Romboutsia sp. 1001216sp1]|uniref:LPD25 domain-containing protein n=1 Tax=unclassified Romboutsia TaxID=2626894 RepID=UPI00189EFC7E|nr:MULTISPECIES: LPD25 domain-containing protein [unclassified Romboutsia]MDB8803177.1 ArdC-like ssDNA-binding domain-containing protein [Romboutsia sp. 1001216sp1]MDB8814536.1 ArdC-like ssDNA-binding domain-containing protein [Romboutsia sp. 1001216sp1]
MKMNEKMINDTVNTVVSSVKFLCENDLTYLQLDRKLNALNEKMDTLQTLVVYSDDDKFTKTVCAMQLVTDNLNDEFRKGLGTTFSNEFRDRQLDFLRNISSSFDVELKDISNIPSIAESKKEIEKEYKKKVNNTKKEYKKETVKETVDDIIKQTNEKLDSYFNDPEDMKEYLKYMSKFYKYSIGNCSLIEKQFEGAEAVGSFKFWKDNGFSVNKGEKGIQILVPTPIKKFIDATGEERYFFTATKEEKEKIKKGELEEAPSGITYKKGYVFDISQTNATADDLPKLFPNKWLEGEIKDYDKFYNAMENVADAIGVKIIPPKQELGVVKGVSYTLTREVALNPRNSQLQNVKTLLHELAHAKLHTATTHSNYTKQEKEFQAEMTAFTICSYFNMDTSEYSLKYLDNYTKNTDIREKKKLLNEIKDTSKEFIEIIENTLAKDIEITKDITNDSDLDNVTNASNTIDDTQVVADVEKPVEPKEQIYVKILWSENKYLDDDSIFTFDAANDIFDTLTEINKANKKMFPNDYIGYDKTKFELHFNKECTDKFYTGRFDIGDGFANDLKEHIYKSVDIPEPYMKISEKQKEILFDILEINPKDYAKSKNKEMDYSL